MALGPARGCRRVVLLTLVVAGVGLFLIGNIPVTTRQGVNFEVSSHRLPLYLKSFEFLARSAEYGQLANEITRRATSDRQRVDAVFDWTARRIKPAPDGWPVIDDHILNIIIRGYGQSDQRADVFATLTTYAGVPAFWHKIEGSASAPGVILTFVKVDGRWAVADVANGFLFLNTSGQLASAEDLATNRAEVPEGAKSLRIGSLPYFEMLKQLRMPPIPGTLRAELQMPGPRLWYQTKRAIGWGRDDGTER